MPTFSEEKELIQPPGHITMLENISIPQKGKYLQLPHHFEKITSIRKARLEIVYTSNSKYSIHQENVNSLFMAL